MRWLINTNESLLLSDIPSIMEMAFLKLGFAKIVGVFIQNLKGVKCSLENLLT